VYAVWFATALPPVIKMLADDQREPGPYGLRTRVEIVDAATGNLRYKALSHCLSEGPKKGAKMPLLKQTVLEKKHLEALATSAAQLRRGQQAGVE
jgi:hypothetical protein